MDLRGLDAKGARHLARGARGREPRIGALIGQRIEPHQHAETTVGFVRAGASDELAGPVAQGARRGLGGGDGDQPVAQHLGVRLPEELLDAHGRRERRVDRGLDACSHKTVRRARVDSGFGIFENQTRSDEAGHERWLILDLEASAQLPGEPDDFTGHVRADAPNDRDLVARKEQELGHRRCARTVERVACARRKRQRVDRRLGAHLIEGDGRGTVVGLGESRERARPRLAHRLGAAEAALRIAREAFAEERGQPVARGGVEALGLDDDVSCRVALRERGPRAGERVVEHGGGGVAVGIGVPRAAQVEPRIAPLGSPRAHSGRVGRREREVEQQ